MPAAQRKENTTFPLKLYPEIGPLVYRRNNMDLLPAWTWNRNTIDTSQKDIPQSKIYRIERHGPSSLYANLKVMTEILAK
jgi:hypothetical protein